MSKPICQFGELGKKNFLTGESTKYPPAMDSIRLDVKGSEVDFPEMKGY